MQLVVLSNDYCIVYTSIFILYTFIFIDSLLCHDDDLEGRRIAFILYLVPKSWKEEDGGYLDLFSTNGK